MQSTIVIDGKRIETEPLERVCPNCRQVSRYQFLRLSDGGDMRLVDPEEVILVSAAEKRVRFELRGGEVILSWHTTVVAVARTYPEIFLPLSTKVLVQRGTIRRAQRMGDAWFVQLEGHEGLIGVSRRKWKLIRSMFEMDSEPISVAAASRAIGQ